MKIAYTNITSDDFRPENQEEAKQKLDAIARQEHLARVYILSRKITPGRKYDDRLEERLHMKRTTIFKYKAEGRLSFIPVEGKLMMTERAIQRFEDGLMPMRVVVEKESSNALAA